MLKLLGDVLVYRLRTLENSDRKTALTRPENPRIPILFKRWENNVYQANASNNLTPFDILMNRVVVFALLILILEYLIGTFDATFALINSIVLVFFLAEFAIRYNYRRFRYLKTWGLFVDLPVILVESIILYMFINSHFSPPHGIHISEAYIAIDHSALHAFQHGNYEWLGFWKVLRLARLLRAAKFIRDFANRTELWKARVRSIFAWARAVAETLLIFLVIIIILAIITRVFTDENPGQLTLQALENIVSRIKADQNTGVKNSEVLQALYQVFAILAAMIIVTFFTQLLLPIANRIKALHENEVSMLGRMHHVILAVTDNESQGLLEEAIQIWAIYQEHDIVVLTLNDIDLENVHPSYTPFLVRGSIYSRSSWLAADISGADQIVILTSAKFDPNELTTFLPSLSKTSVERGILVLSSYKGTTYAQDTDQSGNRYSTMGVPAFKTAIEASVGNQHSIQSYLINELSKKFDRDTNILGTPKRDGDSKKTEQLLNKELKQAKLDSHIVAKHCGDVVLIESGSPPQAVDPEMHEGVIIRKLRTFMKENPSSSPLIVFVESLHLVGINSQLGEHSKLRVVPIELLVLYAAYHESVCTGMAKAWLLPSDVLTTMKNIDEIDSPFARTTYRTRRELRESILQNDTSMMIIGINSRHRDSVFRGFLTDTQDARQVESKDRIVAIPLQD